MRKDCGIESRSLMSHGDAYKYVKKLQNKQPTNKSVNCSEIG